MYVSEWPIIFPIGRLLAISRLWGPEWNGHSEPREFNRRKFISSSPYVSLILTTPTLCDRCSAYEHLLF